MSSDHLTLPKVDLFLIAISTTSTDEEKEQAIFDLLAGPLQSFTTGGRHE